MTRIFRSNNELCTLLALCVLSRITYSYSGAAIVCIRFVNDLTKVKLCYFNNWNLASLLVSGHRLICAQRRLLGRDLMYKRGLIGK